MLDPEAKLAALDAVVAALAHPARRHVVDHERLALVREWLAWFDVQP